MPQNKKKSIYITIAWPREHLEVLTRVAEQASAQGYGSNDAGRNRLLVATLLRHFGAHAQEASVRRVVQEMIPPAIAGEPSEGDSADVFLNLMGG